MALGVLHAGGAELGGAGAVGGERRADPLAQRGERVACRPHERRHQARQRPHALLGRQRCAAALAAQVRDELLPHDVHRRLVLPLRVGHPRLQPLQQRQREQRRERPAELGGRDQQQRERRLAVRRRNCELERRAAGVVAAVNVGAARHHELQHGVQVAAEHREHQRRRPRPVRHVDVGAAPDERLERVGAAAARRHEDVVRAMAVRRRRLGHQHRGWVAPPHSSFCALDAAKRRFRELQGAASVAHVVL